MQKLTLETIPLSELFSSIIQHNPEKYFYCGYLFCKYDLTTPTDFKNVIEILERLNKLLITIKQKNNILQKLSSHQVQNRTIQDMEKTLFQYVDEVVPHLQLAAQFEKTRKESLNTPEIQDTILLNNKYDGQNKPQCPICLEKIQISEMTVLQCSHSFHKSCAQKSFELKIQSSILPLRCLQDECQKQISNKDIAQILTKQYQQKHQTFSFRKFVEENYETMCWCPSIGCQYVFCFENGETAFTCPLCSKFYCLKCRSEYHIGMSCRQYTRSKDIPEDDQKFYQFAEGARYKQCPRCKFWVQKTQGCHHMTCRCKFQFCYICGEDYHNCGCNSEEQAERAELALQAAAEQLRLIRQGLIEHHRQLLRIQGQQRIERDRQFIPAFIEQLPSDNLKTMLEDQQQIRQTYEQEKPLLPSIQTDHPPYLQKYEQPKQEKKIPSTSVGSSEKSKNFRQQFDGKSYVRPSGLATATIQKTFHRSPQTRKTFKMNNANETNPNILNLMSPSSNISKLQYRKPLRSLQKPISTNQKPLVFDRMIHQPYGGIPRLTFTDYNDRKRSQTKY